jgi:hypothetical protein
MDDMLISQTFIGHTDADELEQGMLIAFDRDPSEASCSSTFDIYLSTGQRLTMDPERCEPDMISLMCMVAPGSRLCFRLIRHDNLRWQLDIEPYHPELLRSAGLTTQSRVRALFDCSAVVESGDSSPAAHTE